MITGRIGFAVLKISKGWFDEDYENFNGHGKYTCDMVWSAFGVPLMDHATSCTVAVLLECSRSTLDYKMIEGPSRDEVMLMKPGRRPYEKF